MASSSATALLTDLYQLTMAYGYWKSGMEEVHGLFHLTFRRLPFKGGFTIAAGLQQVIDFIQNFRFEEGDIAYLATLETDHGEPLFEPKFLEYLANLRLSVDVHAVPEGTVVFPQEPLLRVSGPIIQAQILETALLNMINFQTLIATKAARVALSAQGDPVLEFGLRRAQGVDGALSASRAAYIGGCHATSNVLAGKLYGIPVKGTHAHSWVMAFDDELESFMAYAKAMPGNCVFLVDTYDTLAGVDKAIQAGRWLREQGRKMVGIRLDSGDLNFLSIEARKKLDAAGFEDAKIVASNDLDEILIGDLKRQGAQISVWGVGTSLVTAKDQPALDGVYKLSAVRSGTGPWQYTLKLSEQLAKISTPGILQVRRFSDGKENVADVIYDELQAPSDSCMVVDPLDPTRRRRLGSDLNQRDLLVPVFQRGERCYPELSLHTIRANTLEELAQFHDGIKRFLNPHQYVVGLEQQLYETKTNLIKDIRGAKGLQHPTGDTP